MGEGDGGGKKLLILDVNGLLVDLYFAAEDRPSRSHDAKLGKFFVYRRPHCEEFLQFCLVHFHVAVWSSAREHNVMRMVDFIFGESKKLLTFIWNQTHCTDTGMKCLDNIYKPLFLKELQKVWDSSKPDVPWDKGEYGPWNTLLIDDSPHKVLRNPDHTAVLALPFSAMETSSTDDFLSTLQTYLTKVLEVPDVQAFVKSNPIGQSSITEKSRDWKFYSKLKLKVGMKANGKSLVHDTGKAKVEVVDEAASQPASSKTIRPDSKPENGKTRYKEHQMGSDQPGHEIERYEKVKSRRREEHLKSCDSDEYQKTEPVKSGEAKHRRNSRTNSDGYKEARQSATGHRDRDHGPVTSRHTRRRERDQWIDYNYYNPNWYWQNEWNYQMNYFTYPDAQRDYYQRYMHWLASSQARDSEKYHYKRHRH